MILRSAARGRLDRLTIGATVTADYVYDGLERLAIRLTQNMTPAATAHYVYDLKGRLIAEAHDTGQTAREYVWLDDMPLAVVADVDTPSPQLLFVHADHLDRPLKMTDAAQALLWDAVFLPFGEAQSVTTALNLRFPGQYFLIESGLHYNWHRHYDPTTGRYLQPDPLGFVDGPSVYAYASSAPTLEIDPTGRAGIKNWWQRRLPGPEMEGGSGGNRGGSWSSKSPSPGQIRQYERQLEKDGPGSLERSKGSLLSRIEEHLKKIEDARKAGGSTSSMEREVQNFCSQVDAIDQILKRIKP